MVDLGQLVGIGEGKVEMRGQTDIVGQNPGEFLDVCDSGDSLDLGDRDLLFFWRWSWGGRLFDDTNDKALLVGLYLIEDFFVIDELEGLGPVVFISVPHVDNIN